MQTLKCLRCGQEAPSIPEEKPYPGNLGETIAKNICQACWAAWQKFSVNVINDYKLRPFLPQDRAIVEKHMKQFLNLEVSALSPQPITLSGQGMNVTFSDVTKEKVIDMLEQIYDPEIPVNIYDLGLIYDIIIEKNDVLIKMTLTTPHCPAAQSLPPSVQEAVKRIPGVTNAKVEIVWDPPWTREKISEEGKRILGLS